jgi:hypothetical protein
MSAAPVQIAWPLWLPARPLLAPLQPPGACGHDEAMAERTSRPGEMGLDRPHRCYSFRRLSVRETE